jgi:hypothetical protein
VPGAISGLLIVQTEDQRTTEAAFPPLSSVSVACTCDWHFLICKEEHRDELGGLKGRLVKDFEQESVK